MRFVLIPVSDRREVIFSLEQAPIAGTNLLESHLQTGPESYGIRDMPAVQSPLRRLFVKMEIVVHG